MAEQPISAMTVVDSSSSSTHDDNNNNLVILESNNKKDDGVPAKKKKKSANILKVALMLIRRRSRKPNAAVADVASKGMWNRFVGSMRPLHLQTNQSPPHDHQVVVPPSSLPPPSSEPAAVLHASPSLDSFQDVMSSSSSVDGMSRYASAANLQELDQIEDEEEEDEKEKESDGKVNKNGDDEMIDAKAEMFIAKFYAQMRLQRSDSNVRYNQMIKRSIR